MLCIIERSLLGSPLVVVGKSLKPSRQWLGPSWFWQCEAKSALSSNIPCLVVRSEASRRSRAVFERLGRKRLEPAHPLVVTLAARLEAIDALRGAKRHSPRIVWRKPRSKAMPDWLRNHRPDKPKFTGHRRHTCGILSDIKPFDAERHYHWIIGCPHDASSECIGGHE